MEELQYVFWVPKTCGLLFRISSHMSSALLFFAQVTYNQDGSDFYKLATNLKRKFDTQYGKIVKLDASPETAASAAAVSDVTLQDKRAMAKLLYQVTKEDLGKALVEIERKCSDAIQRNAKEDQIELNIDCLSGELVRELTKTLQE